MDSKSFSRFEPGRAVFAAGLGLWAVLSWRLLPYGFHDLGYLIALDRGLGSPKDWVHPLFLPFLAAFKAALGVEVKILIPLELLNLAAGGLGLTALFLWAERASKDSLIAALGALLLAFSPGFWEGALRPDPYSLAAAACVVSLFLLDRERYVWAGVAAGLAAGFHAAALSLFVVAAALARRRSLAFFSAALGLTLLFDYAVFAAHHGLTLEGLRRLDGRELFLNIEQEPLSSLYTSRDPAAQLRDFFHQLNSQAGTLPWLFVGALVFGGAARARVGIIAAAAFAAFSLFFILNNSRNGFVYAALLPLPVLLAVSIKKFKPARVHFAAAAALLAAWGAWRGLPLGPAGDPLLSEARYLDALLAPGDVLALPGCPFPEILYLRPLNVLRTGGGACEAPLVSPGALAARVRQARAHGRRTFAPAPAPRSSRPDAPGDLSGAQKRRQVYASSPGEIEASLGALATDCRYRSPRGRVYCELRGADSPAPAAAPPAPDWARLEQVLRQGVAPPDIRRATDYLRRWLSQSPDDAFALSDLEGVLSRWLAGTIAAGAREAPDEWAASAERRTQELDAAFGGRASVFAAVCAALKGEGLSAQEIAAFQSRLMETRRRLAPLHAERASALRACAALDAGRTPDALRAWEAAWRAAPGYARWGLAGAGPDPLSRLRHACQARPWPGAAAWWFDGRLRDSTRLVDDGIALFTAGRRAEAESRFRQAAELCDDNASAWLSLGAALAASGRGDLALASYDALLSKKLVRADALADALAARANVLVTLGRRAEARRDRLRALKAATPSWKWRAELEAAL